MTALAPPARKQGADAVEDASDDENTKRYDVAADRIEPDEAIWSAIRDLTNKGEKL